MLSKTDVVLVVAVTLSLVVADFSSSVRGLYYSVEVFYAFNTWEAGPRDFLNIQSKEISIGSRCRV